MPLRQRRRSRLAGVSVPIRVIRGSGELRLLVGEQGADMPVERLDLFRHDFTLCALTDEHQ
jgi:hypothetical protein